jgi:sialate O-acetylesterase
MQKSKLIRIIIVTLMVLMAGLTSQPIMAEITLPKVFCSHMVLQQQKPLVIWGWAQPGETVTVELCSMQTVVQANDRGEWKAVLPATNAGGPYTLTVTGSSSVRFDDVMIGEVWLCSGQSNMAFGVNKLNDGEKVVAAANYPDIRLLLVDYDWAPVPQKDIGGAWKVCSPQTLAEGGWGGFSAVAYFFGLELHKKLGVAVGLIESSCLGTHIEPYTAPEGFAAVSALKKNYEQIEFGDPNNSLHQQRLGQLLNETERWVEAARQALTNCTLVPAMPVYPVELQSPHAEQNATALYNGMIYPLCPYTMRGVIWYQGESNLGDGMLYTDKMKALIVGWRQLWKEGDFPFYFVQIAPFNYEGRKPEWMPELWEAQTAAQAIPNTGMIVINDIGDLKDIHPKNKSEVGHRLALRALANTYGQHKLMFAGPTFKSMSIENDKLRLNFDQIGSGLCSRDGKSLSWFEVIDSDSGGFVKADARIEGSTIVLSAPGVKHPVAMRFAWSMLAQPNLMNYEGFPVSSFRAGVVPIRFPQHAQ